MPRTSRYILPVIGLLAACVGGTTTTMPGNAELWFDPASNQYASPPCVAREPGRFAAFTEQTTNATLKARFDGDGDGARPRPSPACRDMMFGSTDPRSASGGFTMTRPLNGQARWAEDGSWNW
jgi:hypothetical protein